MSNYQHRIRHHQSGMKICDRICSAIVLGSIVGGIMGLVTYANYRDTKALNEMVSSVPTRPQDIDENWTPDEQYQHDGC